MTPVPVEFAPPQWGAALALAGWLVGLALGLGLLGGQGFDASTRLAGVVLVPIAGWCAWVYAGEAWRPHPWVRLDAAGLRVVFRRSEPTYSLAWADLAEVGVREEPFLGPIVVVTVRDPARLPPEGAAFWAAMASDGAAPDPDRVPQFLLLPKELRTTAEALRDAIDAARRAER